VTGRRPGGDPARRRRTASPPALSGYQPVVPAADPLIRGLAQRSMRPTDEQMARGTFLRDLDAFNATFEHSYAKVQAA